MATESRYQHLLNDPALQAFSPVAKTQHPTPSVGGSNLSLNAPSAASATNATSVAGVNYASNYSNSNYNTNNNNTNNTNTNNTNISNNNTGNGEFALLKPRSLAAEMRSSVQPIDVARGLATSMSAAASVGLPSSHLPYPLLSTAGTGVPPSSTKTAHAIADEDASIIASPLYRQYRYGSSQVLPDKPAQTAEALSQQSLSQQSHSQQSQSQQSQSQQPHSQQPYPSSASARSDFSASNQQSYNGSSNFAQSQPIHPVTSARIESRLSRVGAEGAVVTTAAVAAAPPPPVMNAAQRLRRLDDELAGLGIASPSRKPLDQHTATTSSQNHTGSSADLVSEKFKSLRAEIVPLAAVATLNQPTDPSNSAAAPKSALVVETANLSLHHQQQQQQQQQQPQQQQQQQHHHHQQQQQQQTAPPLIMFKNLIQEALDDFCSTVRNDIQNLHVEMIKQQMIQTRAIEGMLEKYLPLTTELMDALQACRDENDRLKLKLSQCNEHHHPPRLGTRDE